MSLQKLVKFSIIIPSLNIEHLLHKCLESIIRQTYSSFEILFIDGGSTDSTLKIVTTYGDSRLKVIEAPGSSIYGAMNVGISEASGEYLLFMGADDNLFSSDTLEKLNSYLSKNYDLIIGNAYLGDKPFYSQINYELNFRHTIHHQAILYHYSIFEKFGNFDESFIILADFKFNREIINNGANYILINQFVCKCGKNGVSQRNKWQMRYERLRIVKNLPGYFIYRISKLFKPI
jgi:glycosyltransferase involved in cell wall biosynthesis